MAKAETKTKAPTKAPDLREEPKGNLPTVAAQSMKEFMREFHMRQRAYEPLLPPHLPFDKFESSVRAAITQNPKLVTECNQATMFRACAEAAELGLSLSPTLREADILIRYNKSMGGKIAQFQPRFIGLMKLARQSGEIEGIDAHEVYSWDEFDYEHGLEERLVHKPGAKPMDYDKKPHWGVIAAYCIWKINGEKKFEVMDLADLIRIMNRSSSKDRDSGEITGPWKTDFPEMCRKTVVRRASKYMPLSAENMKRFAAAVNLDDKREGGESVTLNRGEVVDITDDIGDDAPPPAEQQKPTQQAASQVDDLESRMTGKKAEPKAEERKPAPATIDNPPQPRQQQAPVEIARIDVPMINGRPDWVTWLRMCEVAVAKLPNEAAMKAWRVKHQDLLDGCEFNVPDEMGALLKLLP